MANQAAAAARGAVKAAIQKWGRTFTGETNGEMLDLITKLHESEGEKDFEGVVGVERGARYGGVDERQRLDVYYPAAGRKGKEVGLPVVLYFHGGGMVFGDTETTPLFYSNIGNFFASNACVAIISTYRLLPTAKHPDGANDAVAAIKWTLDNAASYGGSPSTNLTLIGHSAGGSILSTALWGGFLQQAGVLPALSQHATFIYLSAGLWYDVDHDPTKTNMSNYHRTADQDTIRREMPVSLLEQALAARAQLLGGLGFGWPRQRFWVAEWEFEEIERGTRGVEGVWDRMVGGGGGGRGVEGGLEVEIVEGENHVSYIYSLGTEGSWMGKRLLEIVKG